MKKILFLDFDGVLNTKFWNGQGKKDKYGHLFDPNAVDNLAKIIEETGASIVLTVHYVTAEQLLRATPAPA